MRTARFTLALLLLAAVTATAQIPQTINYQGRARDAGNQPVTGSHSMTLKLYNSATGGSALWQEAQTVVFTAEGIFTVALGSKNPLTLPFDEQYWLGVTISGVNSGAELPERWVLRSTPYSLRAQTADSALVAKTTRGIETPAAIAGFNADGPLLDVSNGGSIGLQAEGSDYGIVSFGPVKTTDHYIAEQVVGDYEAPHPGSYYYDNAPIAWAQVDRRGNVIAKFGIDTVLYSPNTPGYYEVILSNPVTLGPANKPTYPTFAPMITTGGIGNFGPNPDEPFVVPAWTYKLGTPTTKTSIIVMMRGFDSSTPLVDFPFSIVVFGRPE